MAHNLVPQPPKLAALDLQEKTLEAFARLLGKLVAFASSVVAFLVVEHPRGPVPRGPVAIGATARVYCIAVTWRNENTNATVDYFAIYRADAGTAASPTTPTFASAICVSVVSSGRCSRIEPVNSRYSYLDSDFTAADRAAGRRFAYWVKSISNEFHESPPVAIGTYVTVP